MIMRTLSIDYLTISRCFSQSNIKFARMSQIVFCEIVCCFQFYQLLFKIFFKILFCLIIMVWKCTEMRICNLNRSQLLWEVFADMYSSVCTPDMIGLVASLSRWSQSRPRVLTVTRLFTWTISHLNTIKPSVYGPTDCQSQLIQALSLGNKLFVKQVWETLGVKLPAQSWECLLSHSATTFLPSF